MMQELEKILEEIEKLRMTYGFQSERGQHLSRNNNMIIDAVENIIRKHMNDGWIPVEERLPEKDGFYIATIDGEIIGEDDPVVGLAEYDRGYWYDDEDYTRVIAWRPLPEPYRPERSNKE